MTITVYSKPNCPACKGTYRALDKAGLLYDTIDISLDEAARDYVVGLGHTEAPVVMLSNGESWSGYRPDRIKGLL